MLEYSNENREIEEEKPDTEKKLKQWDSHDYYDLL